MVNPSAYADPKSLAEALRAGHPRKPLDFLLKEAPADGQNPLVMMLNCSFIGGHYNPLSPYTTFRKGFEEEAFFGFHGLKSGGTEQRASGFPIWIC